jgi:hypothetical protein
MARKVRKITRRPAGGVEGSLRGSRMPSPLSLPRGTRGHAFASSMVRQRTRRVSVPCRPMRSAYCPCMRRRRRRGWAHLERSFAAVPVVPAGPAGPSRRHARHGGKASPTRPARDRAGCGEVAHTLCSTVWSSTAPPLPLQTIRGPAGPRRSFSAKACMHSFPGGDRVALDVLTPHDPCTRRRPCTKVHTYGVS